MATPSSQNLRLFRGTPTDASLNYGEQIDELKHEYYSSLGVYAPGDVEAIIDEQNRSWDDPNAANQPGDSTKSKPEVIVGYEPGSDNVHGFVYVANDASSRKPKPLDAIEKFAKLHIPLRPFLESRFVWVREIMASDDFLFDALLYAATLRRNRHQEVALYPWRPEKLLIARATERGFELTKDFGEPRQFGSSRVVVDQARMKTTQDDLIPKLIEKHDSSPFIGRVKDMIVR